MLDDYLTKPFHLEELKARLDALIRRAAGYASPVVEKGPLSLDLGAKEARLRGDTLELTAFEYRVPGVSGHESSPSRLEG